MSLEATILTSPDEGISLDNDIRHVKLSILYSDKITLISPKSSMLIALMQMSSFSNEQQLEFIKEVGPIIDPKFSIEQLDFALEKLKVMQNKKRKTREELVAICKFKSSIGLMNKGFQEMGENFYAQSKFRQLFPLIESGQLEFKHFDTGYGKEDISDFMLKEVIEALSHSSTKYPVFDNLMSSIAYHYSIENNISIDHPNPKEIEFGKEVILELPNIDQFDISDIQNLKAELTNELNKFKGAILSYSKGIQAISYSEESKHEIQKQYNYYIKPELESLRRQIKKNRYINLIIDDVMSNQSKYFSHSIIGIGLCTIFEFEKFIAAAGVLSEAGFTTLKKRNENLEKIKEHPLFFLNEVKRLK